MKLILRFLVGSILLFNLAANGTSSKVKSTEEETPIRAKYGFGFLELGQSQQYTFTFTLNPLFPSYEISNFWVNGDTDLFSLIDDSCSNQTMPGGSQCSVTIRFTAGKVGSFSASWGWELKRPGGLPPVQYLGASVDGSGVFKHDDSNPGGSPGGGACAGGSIIRVDSQSLGELVPIVGTNYTLMYSSAFSPAYVTSDPLPVGFDLFANGGWTVNVHHYYEFYRRKLFSGTGTFNLNARTWVSSVGNINVLSEDNSEVYVFETSGRHLETKFALTGATKYLFAYDSSGKLSTITDAFGNVTQFIYASGSFSIVAPFGQTTNVSLNSNNLVSSITNPNSETYSFTYGGTTSLMSTFTKPGGQVSSFTYSSSGRLTKDEGQGGNFWTLLENLTSTGRIVTMSSKLGRTTVYRSNQLSGDNVRYSVDSTGLASESHQRIYGDRVSEESPIQRTGSTLVQDLRFPDQVAYRKATSWIDKGGNTSYVNYSRTYTPSSFADPYNFTSITETRTISSRVTSEVYTSATKTSVLTSPMGATVTSVFDAFQRLTSNQVGSDTPITYVFNSVGQLTAKDQGAFNSISNTYNTEGLLSSQTNGRGETTSYGYDLAGRVTSVTRPDTKVTALAYDSNGNLIGVTPPGRLLHSYEFNPLELMSKYDPPALSGLTVKETLYDYNLDKQLTSIVRPDMQSALYTYGSTSGLLDKVTLSRGESIYTYRTNTPLISRIDSADGIRSNFTYYGYDIKSEEQRRSSDDFLMAMIQYGFDADHRMTSRGIRGNYPLFSTINTTYNNDDEPTAIGAMALTYSYPTGRLATTTLNKISDSRTYDSLGNLESYTATYNPTGLPAVVLYTYTLTRDVMSRIVGKSETIQGVTSTYVYSYDNVGRLTGVTKDGSSYSSYGYDDNGNRVSGSVAGTAIVATYDAQDRLTTYNTRTYTHNANGDVTGIQYSPTVQSTYSYDALGKLLAAVTPLGSTSYSMDGRGNIVRILNGGTTLTRYIYDDKNRIAGEFTDAGVMWRQFVYGTDEHSPDYLVDSTGTIRIIKDHLGSPRLFLKVTDGTVMQRMDYDEFGRVIANTNPTYQPFGFAGGLYLRLPGLVKFGARYYDPEVGRWSSKDPIQFDGNDMNLYGYVLLDPVNRIDPKGLFSEDWVKERTTPNQQMVVGTGMAAAGAVCIRAGFATLNLPLILTGVGLGYEGGKNVMTAKKRGAPQLPDLSGD